MHTVYLANESETLALGAKLSRRLAAGNVVALTGDLGAGKTTFSRGVIRALCHEDEVPSPTYTLVQVYDAPDCEVWHCDMYRLERPEDAYELGLMDAFEEAICLIEWPEKLGSLLPENAYHIHFAFDEDRRVAMIKGWGELGFDT